MKPVLSQSVQKLDNSLACKRKKKALITAAELYRTKIYSLGVLCVLIGDFNNIHAQFLSIVSSRRPRQRKQEDIKCIDVLGTFTGTDTRLVMITQLCELRQNKLKCIQILK